MSSREDCFANNGKYCVALNEKRCYNCKFYRNDLNRENIEKDINVYGLNSKNLKKPGGENEY